VPDQTRLTETNDTGTQEKDSILKTTTVAGDSIKPELKVQNNDSLRVLIEKDRKKKKDSIRSAKENEIRLVAYYFHPTARCVTCRNIESYSYEAIQQWEEKNKKNIGWKELNIDDSVNEHYIEEFDLEFSSLVIVKYIGGKRDKWKNLADTWKLVNDKPVFQKYILFELNQFAKDDKSNERIN
jgi:hypothetical protein